MRPNDHRPPVGSLVIAGGCLIATMVMFAAVPVMAFSDRPVEAVTYAVFGVVFGGLAAGARCEVRRWKP